MPYKKQLFRKITLKNFMLHEQTTVDLAAEAITLITGANGSGKTQILDGLIICLGYIPTRARAKGLGSLVGSNGKHAEIVLEVGNPLVDGVRTIHTLDKDLNKTIAFDDFRITAKISQEESSVTYAINNSRRIIRGRTVTRRDIRRIFDAINVRGNNQLAFTGEGTVDEFASKSARRKLDVLLEVTGLKQYREEVVEAQQTLKASIQEIEPLKRKYETERKLLNIWQEAMDILKQKKKLMILRRKLEIEQAWAHVVRMEKQLESINQERTEIIRQRTENERAIREKKQELTIAEKKLDQLKEELDRQDEEELNKNRKIITFEAQMRNEQDNITSFTKEIGRYQQQITKLEKVLKTKNLSTKDKHIRDKQETLVIKNKKLSLIQDKLTKVEEELSELRKEIVLASDWDELAYDDEVYSGKRLTKYETDMKNAATIFYRKLCQAGLNNEVLGPIISLINMKEGYENWERPVRNLLGRHLFAFLATTDDSYRAAKSLYDRIWSRWKPPLSVYKVTQADATRAEKRLPKPPYKEIFAIATNLLEGEPVALGFLKRVNKNAVSEDKFGPNILTKIARESHINILTKSTNSFYLSQGGFGRPPAPMVTSMGWTVPEDKRETVKQRRDERKTRVTIARLEKERRELKLDEIKTLGEISTLHQEIQAIGLPDEKILGKIEALNEIIAVIKKKISDCKKYSRQLKHKLLQANETFSHHDTQTAAIKKQIADAQEIISFLKVSIQSLKEKNSRLLTMELTYDSDYDKLLDDKKEREVIAKEKGERPEEIREYSEIRDELKRIEGHLESIGISNVDEEKIEAQKAKVESLKQYMIEREEHITNLRKDLEARLEFWSGELREVIENITRSMKLLLGGIFDQIRLRVNKITNPAEAGLYIEAVTKGNDFRDFRELSGGERVLAVEGLILAMHTLTDSPIHAIDEFTQRLDEKNKALAFSIAVRTQKLASESSRFVPQFILLCPEALEVCLSEEIHHVVVSELKVMKAEQR